LPSAVEARVRDWSCRSYGVHVGRTAGKVLQGKDGDVPKAWVVGEDGDRLGGRVPWKHGRWREESKRVDREMGNPMGVSNRETEIVD